MEMILKMVPVCKSSTADGKLVTFYWNWWCSIPTFCLNSGFFFVRTYVHEYFVSEHRWIKCLFLICSCSTQKVLRVLSYKCTYDRTDLCWRNIMTQRLFQKYKLPGFTLTSSLCLLGAYTSGDSFRFSSHFIVGEIQLLSPNF